MDLVQTAQRNLLTSARLACSVRLARSQIVSTRACAMQGITAFVGHQTTLPPRHVRQRVASGMRTCEDLCLRVNFPSHSEGVCCVLLPDWTNVNTLGICRTLQERYLRRVFLGSTGHSCFDMRNNLFRQRPKCMLFVPETYACVLRNHVARRFVPRISARLDRTAQMVQRQEHHRKCAVLGKQPALWARPSSWNASSKR